MRRRQLSSLSDRVRKGKQQSQRSIVRCIPHCAWRSPKLVCYPSNTGRAWTFPACPPNCGADAAAGDCSENLPKFTVGEIVALLVGFFVFWQSKYRPVCHMPTRRRPRGQSFPTQLELLRSQHDHQCHGIAHDTACPNHHCLAYMNIKGRIDQILTWRDQPKTFD